MRKILRSAVLFAFAVSLIICLCINEIKAEEVSGADVIMNFGLWTQTNGEYALPLTVEGEWSALLLEISLPEGCKITDVSVIDRGRAASSAFLTVKNRAAVALNVPEPFSPPEKITLNIRFTAKGGAKGRATARAAEENSAFFSAAARPDGAPLDIRPCERELELTDDRRVEFLGTQSGTRADGSKFTRVLYNLIYVGDERRTPTAYVTRGRGVVCLTVTEVKTPRGAILAYTFDGEVEDLEIAERT